MMSRFILAAFVTFLGATLVACEEDKAGEAPEAAPSPSAVASAPKPVTSSPPEPSSIPAPADVAAPPADAKKTASGLASRVLTPGTGKVHPGPMDRVKVNYTGWTKQGSMFDSSVARSEPATFPLNGVIPGWTEGLQLMVVGEKRRFWVPAALAYGEHPRMGQPGGDLVFDVELLEILPNPKAPPVPEDLKAPPASAKKLPDGLAYEVLAPGTGSAHPTASSNVTVNYTGWTADGHMFDSSIPRGEPSRFGLGGVIKGWTEGVQLMAKGEKARFWIPAALAYGNRPMPGKPTGPLVFDIELLDFQ